MHNPGLFLAVNVRRLRRVKDAPQFAGRGTRWTRRHHACTCFDTPRLRLHRNGVVVTVRRKGRRWEQQVRRCSDVPPDSARRFIANGAPVLTRLDVPLLGAALNRDPAQIVLKPVFESRIERTCRELAVAPGVRIGISVDHGSLVSGNASLPVNEVQLTLLAGKYTDLLDFARRLRANVPFVVEPRSRIERGYALHEGNVLVPVKAGHLSLAREMTVADACSAIVGACLAHFEANQLGMLGSADTEFLHQMRVALRRLRSAVALFNYTIPQHAWQTAVADMRWLGRALGPARDWDVLMTERLPEMKRQFRHEEGMEELLHECEQRRRRALERARRAVRSARCQCFLLALAHSIEGRAWAAALNVLEQEAARQNIVAYAAAILEQRYQLVRKRGRSIARLNDTELHRLRIAVKKLRYAAEFFGALFDGGRSTQFRSAASALQDVLGRINDIAAANAMLADVNRPPQRALTTACALISGWNRHEVHRMKTGLVDIWKVFRSAPPFWRDRQPREAATS